MAEVAHALKDILLRTKANQKAFSDSYQGTHPECVCGVARPACCWKPGEDELLPATIRGTG
jgi:hypothetical protein